MIKTALTETTRTEERVISHTCDRCGREMIDNYRLHRMEIIAKEWDDYEGEHTTSEECDLCENCAFEIRQLLEKNGCKFNDV